MQTVLPRHTDGLLRLLKPLQRLMGPLLAARRRTCHACGGLKQRGLQQKPMAQLSSQ
jgi:hypothetical protein